MLRTLTNAFKGPAQARAAHRQALRLNPGITLGVNQLQTLCPADGGDDAEAPIFVLSAGWRSGSTLLQRLVMSDPSVLIWGEPYDECGLIQALADSMKAFRPGWPPQEYFYDGTPPDQLTGEWIANLFPSLEDWRKGQRALFDAMFAMPAKRAGAKRWGIKEVRLTAEHCAYLRWLYPKARFLFLIRNPLEAYRSYCRYGRSWYDVFPHRPVFTPTAFGRHWKMLAEGMLDQAISLDAQVIRYEDLISGKVDLTGIERYLGTNLDHAVLNKKVGSSERGGEKAKVNALEKWLLRRAVSPLAEQLGYK
ncbi:MAG: hypothetical protein B7Y41_04690 [Hydrogenophilales bacterium 28-61-23]|nr:MAG: hypothetical protein B7Y41_04690 [Hydrogenophilales bacterium 28-61-23]